MSASLAAAEVTKAANGARSVVLSVHAGETVTATATVKRGATVLGRATGLLTGGAHR